MDASRNSEINFSPPVLQFDFTYLVPASSDIRSVADADRSGIRIAVVLNHASTLCLNRMRKHAELVEAETPETAFELLRLGRVGAWASTRPALLEFSSKLSGSWVIEDCFGANFTAMTVPKGHAERLAYISEFIEEAKSSGLVQRAITRSGWRGVHVAPLSYRVSGP
jgi:polar amino acid transport system substrate-binding protein